MPITAANFDDASVTTAVTYTGTPVRSDSVDGIDVSPLLMETDYYFAVEATDAGGNRSGIATTAGATRSPFLVTRRLGHGCQPTTSGKTSMAQVISDAQLGEASWATEMSDLLVGTNGGGRAYMFMGAAAGYAATPTVIFTGAFSGFGSAIANAGDIDGDMLDDIAITSTNDGTGKVYIYSRKPPQPSGPCGDQLAVDADRRAGELRDLRRCFVDRH